MNAVRSDACLLITIALVGCGGTVRSERSGNGGSTSDASANGTPSPDAAGVGATSAGGSTTSSVNAGGSTTSSVNAGGVGATAVGVSATGGAGVIVTDGGANIGRGAGGTSGSGGYKGGSDGNNGGGGTDSVNCAGRNGSGGSWCIGTGGVMSSGGASTGGMPSLLNPHFSFIGAPPTNIPVECAPDGSCPDGKKCFQLTKEVGICDDPVFAIATECTPPSMLVNPDECGCGGLTCRAGFSCRWFAYYSENTGYNRCVADPCSSPADCADGDVCTPPAYDWPWTSGRCTGRVCHSDADCGDAGQGQCVVEIATLANGGEPGISAIRCSNATP